MENKTIGWVLISIALLISAFANWNCSFGCSGAYASPFNQLTIIGIIFYASGTYFILKKEGGKENDDEEGQKKE